MVENTLNIGKISEGFVLDHIKAGKSMDIYKYLKLDQLDCCVAIIKNVIRCHNPRCITSIEQGLDHVFVLTDPENEVYRCKYCEEKYNRKRG